MANKKCIELLAPAKNVSIGKIAIDAGADAVYIGAPQFSARMDAGNSIKDIAELVRYAHIFSVRVLVALNTILTDDELPIANKLIWDLYHIGVDAIILQDLGLLETKLPPIRLHASTQCNNQTFAKVKWLEDIGFQRVVLARELTLAEIQHISKHTNIELEAFVHGACCVSYSGQCYLSAQSCGRSANRGVCSQMCRQSYDILDANQKVIRSRQYALSLQDMDRSQYLRELLDAGISSLKIEGRLKDADYVKNIVSYYRRLLDGIFSEANCPYQAASVGIVSHTFSANPAKTFHRGGIDYFLHGRRPNMVNMWSPKSTGEKIGIVRTKDSHTISIQTEDGVILHNGDGICYKDSGFLINSIEHKGNLAIVYPNQKTNVGLGEILYRNLDIAFLKSLHESTDTRKLPISISFRDTDEGFVLQMNEISQTFNTNKEEAQNAERSWNTIKQQLCKLGDTPFIAQEVNIDLNRAYFLPISLLNEWRRIVSNKLLLALSTRRPVDIPHTINHPVFCHQEESFKLNIHNTSAQTFYSQCNITTAPSYESHPISNADLMTCRYCLRYEMGICSKQKADNKQSAIPAYLRHGAQLYQLVFDCEHCQMKVKLVE